MPVGACCFTIAIVSSGLETGSVEISQLTDNTANLTVVLTNYDSFEENGKNFTISVSYILFKIGSVIFFCVYIYITKIYKKYKSL